VRKRALIGLLLLIILSGIGYALWAAYGPQAERENNVVSASGTIEATEVNVGAQTGGVVKEVLVSEGDSVEKDEILLRLDDALLQDKIDLAQADLDAAKANLSKAESAESARQITAEDVEIARSKVRQAEIALRTARTQASFAVVRSPIEGTILTVTTNPGEVVAPAVALVVVGDIDKVELVIFIREDELGKVKLNQKVKVKVDSYPDRNFSGRVSFIASEAEFTPGTVQTREERVTTVYAVKIFLPNEEHILKPGMPADAEIEVD
jgi:RND family efflux transporter MFP subunit